MAIYLCGSTMSYTNAGVPIKAPVAGIAMGLIENGGKLASFWYPGHGRWWVIWLQGSRHSQGRHCHPEKSSRYMVCPLTFCWQPWSRLTKAVSSSWARLQHASISRQTICPPMHRRSLPLPFRWKKSVMSSVPAARPSIRSRMKPVPSWMWKKTDMSKFSTDEAAAEQAKKMVEGLTHVVKPAKPIFPGSPSDEVRRIRRNPTGNEGLVHVSQLALQRVEKPEDFSSRRWNHGEGPAARWQGPHHLFE